MSFMFDHGVCYHGTRILRALALVVALMVVASCPAGATWYGENVANGSDIMMMDVRWPWWPESTYFANWNFAFNPPGITGYGGFAIGAPVMPDRRPNLDPELQAELRPGSVWSFWGANKDGEPVRVTATSEYTYPQQYIGEGASGSLGGPTWPFIQQNRWYTMMMRVWQPLGVKNPQVAYLGRWVKDVNSRQWKLYGIVRLPVPATSFTSNAGFLEDFGNNGRSVRSLHRRLGYCRKDGKWLKSDTVTYDVPPRRGEMDTYWVVNKQQEGDHEILEMELSSNRALLPLKLHGEPLELGKKQAFTVRQPNAPNLDLPQVSGVKALSNGHQVAVSWHIPASSAPQFAYRIEIFDNPACKGRPRSVREERMPTVRTALIDAAIARPTVRLTITDVFDQQAAPDILNAAIAPTAIRSMGSAVRTDPGLKYTLLYQDASRRVNVLYPAGGKSEQSRGERHSWLSLAELKAGHRIQSGISRGFDTDLRGERSNAYAFQFRGLLRAPTGGLYLLHMQGSDGYRITIDGHDALIWDGPHGPTEKTAMLNLARGDHPLAVEYYVDQSPAPFFKLEWEGPGLVRQEIPRTALFHAGVGQVPKTELVSRGGTDGTATITVGVDPKGHRLARVLLFLGKLQIAEGAGPKLTFVGPMPEGTSNVWARLLYDTDHTLDTEPMPVTVTGPTVKGWDFSVVGENRALRGVWQTGPDAFSFCGEGEYVISRKTRGDFTLTCRVDAYAGAQGEPVNAASWVGLTAREDGSKQINSGWGREFGLMQTGRDGLRTTPNSSDLGGARISDYVLPNNRPWLRIARQGNQWTAWTSADGVAWEHGTTHFIPARNEMDAGLVFRALPQDARAYFHARVSRLTLQPGVASDLIMPSPIPAKNTAGPRLTGVVISPSDPNVVVVRSSNLGLLRSTDGGKDWAPANGALVGADNSVRSVAIDPQDPKVMLRAAGRADRNGAFAGSLALTHDGGMTWQTLAFPGDFDGEGPSALCGEVIGFDPANSQILFAGCETRGFFRSADGGKTWKLVGAVGERITAITVNRWVRGAANQAYLHVVTCPDAWMPLLGRGKPIFAARVTTSHDYVSRDGGLSLQRICERTDLGYLNAAFDKGAWPEELPYATTHGILKALGDGERTFLFPPAKNLDCLRPVTALACSALDDGYGRCLTQPLDPSDPGRFSRSDAWAYNWDWQTFGGARPTGGLISVCGEYRHGKQWWLVATDGLYRSDDGGITLSKLLDTAGIRVH